MRPNFQKHPSQLKRQQEILKALGYYSGDIDGSWGPKSMEAMQTYERSLDFMPCFSNNGMPLGAPPFPLGVLVDPKDSFLLYHPAIEKLKAALSVTPKPESKVEPPVSEPTPQVKAEHSVTDPLTTIEQLVPQPAPVAKIEPPPNTNQTNPNNQNFKKK